MLDKKQEFIAEALDEIRDEYIDEAVTYVAVAGPVVKRKNHRRFIVAFGPIAACMVLVITLGIYQQFSYNGGPSGSGGGVVAEPGAAEQGIEAGKEVTAGGGAATGGGEAVDITANVEAGESTGNPCGNSQQSLLEYHSAEEILAEGTAIIRGTVEKMACYDDYSILHVVVTDVIRGELQTGSICEIEIPVVPGEYENSISGDLSKLAIGSEAIFMPHKKKDGSFYYSEGIRYLFLETGDGVFYATDVYEVPDDGMVTLDDVAAYLRKMIQ